MRERRIRRSRRGELTLRLPAEERELLRGLPAQLRSLLDEEPDDPSLRRLFPPAYTHAPEHEAEYRRLMGDELREKHLAALAVLEETSDAERLSEEQANSWLSAINDVRLVLGTRLDVSEDMLEQDVDPSDPRAPALALYGYLSWLEEQMVEALASAY
ncbi:MAG: DUF2017 domain-containing protein [Actinomycetota bacterium]|nr:DUF2017 domain-containing protein [Actinomycetota bacterium]